jgi:sirohydrochlorin cobaltochelatase
LFSGKLIDRIYNYVDRVATKTPGVTFLKAHYLADQDHVINTFVDRIAEAQNGTINDNYDLMASFKKRLALGEIDIHHHHAEYQSFTDPDDEETLLQEEKNHPHNHSHSHSHGVYRHIGHPNGPRTMIDQGVCCCFMSQFPDHVVEEQRELIKTREIGK